MGRFRLPLCAAILALLVAAPAAHASFHEILIREVKAGGAANDSYVVLQAYKSGQNFVGGHSVTAYDAAGGTIGTFAFSGTVANGQNQMTILVADTSYAASFLAGPAPDKTEEDLDLDPAGGAVCWAGIDCVAWGSFSGSLPSPAGTPAASGGIPGGAALRRTIAPGCATLLELGDDHDNSAADFFPEAPAPRSNATVPAEKGCGGSVGGGGGGGSAGAPAGRGAPQTTLRRKPPKRSRDRTPTFRFGADEAGARFECRIDKRPFRPCKSPYTAKSLSFGRHLFAVRARDASGDVDPSPASCAFRVLRDR